MMQQLFNVLVCLVTMVAMVTTQPLFVDITRISSAVSKGAVCLDGSPPAYYLDRGFDTGVNSWLIYLAGGGWCATVKECDARKQKDLGSSNKWSNKSIFSGILNNKRESNPDFYSWNRVLVAYCDGSSFTGDVERVDPAEKIYFRGARVFRAVMEDLLTKGMKNAENAILSGCSAGGLGAILNCDSFRALLPMSTRVKCVSDAGFFLHAKDITGQQTFEAMIDDVVTLHGSAKNLPQSCTSWMKPGLCFFPQYAAKHVQTPLFFINSAYDYYQVQNILVPPQADPQKVWEHCFSNLTECTLPQLLILQGFRLEFIIALKGLGISWSRGFFINSCYEHCQTDKQDTWFLSKTQLLANKSIAQATGDWFYDMAPFQEIDCPYPCDKTCRVRPHNHVI